MSAAAESFLAGLTDQTPALTTLWGPKPPRIAGGTVGPATLPRKRLLSGSCVLSVASASPRQHGVARGSSPPPAEQMLQPAAQKRGRPAGLSGTMVSYAEVKSYLSKREIPQLFESLMAGLMYHRPENHIGYLQSCLDEVRANADTKVQWSTFVNARKRKSKEILPPLKQDGWTSDSRSNSRQSTPLPPISARSRTAGCDVARNTYILYHYPPPVLAKPKVPVVSVVGGLGTRVDELCERVVGRLRGVVHLSTSAMLHTRMAVEGFSRVTAVPACAVVDSVLQAMSMVHSASALMVAGFPRNRGDIEEYRSRQVRMDGVVLVDLEEDALRRLLHLEVSSGSLRPCEVEAELERHKQDIISVAEYYDDKQLLTVVMGDQDMDETVDDIVLAVDKIVESRRDVDEEEGERHKCGSGEECKALVASPQGLDRPSTVEIAEATEEDIMEALKNKGEGNQQLTTEALSARDDVGSDVTADQDESKSPEEPECSVHEEGASKGDRHEIAVDNNDSNETKDVNSCTEVQEMEVETLESSDSLEAVNSQEEVPSEGNQEEVDDECIQETIANTGDLKENVSSTTDQEIKKSGSDEETKNSCSDQDDKDQNCSQDDVNKSEHLTGSENTCNEDRESEKNTVCDEEASDICSGESESDAETAVLESRDNDSRAESNKSDLPLIFAFQNIQASSEEVKDLIVNKLGMCFIDFRELSRDDGNEDESLGAEETLLLMQCVLKQDSVSYSNGFFIWKFPLTLVGEEKFKNILKIGDITFVCKLTSEDNEDEAAGEKTYLSSFNDKIRLIFVGEGRVLSDMKTALLEIVRSIENKDESEDTEGDGATAKDLPDISTSKESAESIIEISPEVENEEVESKEKAADVAECGSENNSINCEIDKEGAEDKEIQDNSLPNDSAEDGDEDSSKENQENSNEHLEEVINGNNNDSNDGEEQEEMIEDAINTNRCSVDSAGDPQMADTPTSLVRQATFSADSRKMNEDQKTQEDESVERETRDLLHSEINSVNDENDNTTPMEHNSKNLEGNESNTESETAPNGITSEHVSQSNDEATESENKSREETELAMCDAPEEVDSLSTTTKSTVDIAEEAEAENPGTPDDTEAERADNENREVEVAEKLEESENEALIDNKTEEDIGEDGGEPDSTSETANQDNEEVDKIERDQSEGEDPENRKTDELDSETHESKNLSEAEDDKKSTEETKADLAMGDGDPLDDTKETCEDEENGEDTTVCESHQSEAKESKDDECQDTDECHNSDSESEVKEGKENDTDIESKNAETENDAESNDHGQETTEDTEQERRPEAENDTAGSQSESTNESKGVDGEAANDETTAASPSRSYGERLNSTSISIRHESGVSQCLSVSSEDERTVLIETTAEIHAVEDDEVLTVSIAEIESYPHPPHPPDQETADASEEADIKDPEEAERGSSGEDRLSNKIIERNGSGILGDGRHEEHHLGEEEQQERSSSSSRGEL